MKKILIVDNDSYLPHIFSRALHSCCDFKGEVKVVGDGESAIKEVNSNFYNICFLDIQLPDSNGLDILERVKDISPETTVVIMSVFQITEDMNVRIRRGAYIFLVGGVASLQAVEKLS